MNDVTISATLRGGFEEVSNDGVKFTLVSSSGRSELDEFIVLAYGNSAQFLRQHANSGDRLVAQGRLSSEKLDTDSYHTAVTINRVLSISPAENGIDFSRVVVSGVAACDGVKSVGQNGRKLANLNIANSRQYMSRSGEERSYTTYLNATLWGDRAEQLEQDGLIPMENERVMIEGILKPRSYTNREGQEVNKIDIWIDDLVFAQAQYSPQPRQKQPVQNSQETTQPATPPQQQQQTKNLDSSPF